MEKFLYQLKDGRTLTLEGDREPTDSEIEAAAASAGVELALADEAAADAPEMGTTEPNMGTEDLPEPTPEPTNLPPPGVLATVGQAIKSGAPMIRRGAETVARKVATSPLTQRILAGGVGHAVGVPAAIATGGLVPPWIGGLAGFQFGKKYAKQGAEKAAEALSSTMPRITSTQARAAARGAKATTKAATKAAKMAGTAAKVAKVGQFGKLPAGRKAMNMLFSRLIPGVGNALLAADAANLGYQAGTKIDEKLDLSSILGRNLAPLMGGNRKDYDAMVRAIAEQEGR